MNDLVHTLREVYQKQELDEILKQKNLQKVQNEKQNLKQVKS